MTKVYDSLDQAARQPGHDTVVFEDTDRALSVTMLELSRSLERTSTIQLRDLMGLIGEQGLLLFCIFLIIPFLLPVSIPGVSTLFGLMIILISVGIVLNRILWLPAVLLDRELATEHLIPALQKGSHFLSRIDRFIRPRLVGLTHGSVINRFNGMGLLLGGVLLIFPLGLIPFSNTLPALAILFLSIGILQRDGLFIVLGYLMLIASLAYFGGLAIAAVAAGSGLSSLLSSSMILPILW